MALIAAKHAVFGDVIVPDSYLEMWPDDYTAAHEAEPVEAPQSSRSHKSGRTAEADIPTTQGE